MGGQVYGQTYNAPYEIPRFQGFLGGCKLQAPTSATVATPEVLRAGYTSSNFYVVDTDKVAFNQTGDSRRTELRDETNWTVGGGDISLHGTIRVVEQTCDQVTLMQIHDDANVGNGPNKPLLRIYKHDAKSPVGHIWAAIKTDAGGVNTEHYDLGLAPDDYFEMDVRIESGNMIIDYQGEEKVNVDVSYWVFPSYWKAGVYLQDDGEATAYFDELYSTGINQSPTISITSPSSGSTLNVGEELTITAEAQDNDGTVSQVEFFVTGTSIGVATTSPYTVNWTVEAGPFTLTAIATDDMGARTGSAGVSITGIAVLGGIDAEQEAFLVYPNPSAELVTLKGVAGPMPGLRVQVMTPQGKILEEVAPNNIQGNTLEIDISHYASGVYLLVAVADGKRSVYPIIKE
ncbi:MAG: polysaccharide lyase family 7 protein [Bacteroidota bacterium]